MLRNYLFWSPDLYQFLSGVMGEKEGWKLCMDINLTGVLHGTNLAMRWKIIEFTLQKVKYSKYSAKWTSPPEEEGAGLSTLHRSWVFSVLSSPKVTT